MMERDIVDLECAGIIPSCSSVRKLITLSKASLFRVVRQFLSVGKPERESMSPEAVFRDNPEDIMQNHADHAYCFSHPSRAKRALFGFPITTSS